LEDPGIDRIILKWTFREMGWGAGTGSIWLRIGAADGLCVGGNELSGSIIAENFLSSYRIC
jgi:hypothetical protein